MDLSPEEKNAALKLIKRFGDESILDEKFWTELFRTDSLRVLPLDDPELSTTIRQTFGTPNTPVKIASLFVKAEALVRKVVERRNKYALGSNSGGLSIRVDTNEPPFPAAIQAATALRLCQIFVLYVSKHFSPFEGSKILGRGNEESLEGLVDVTLELIADTNIVSTYYEVILEGANLLLSLLSAQFFALDNPDFATSIDEDNDLAMTFYNQMKAHEAAGAAMKSNQSNRSTVQPVTKTTSPSVPSGATTTSAVDGASTRLAVAMNGVSVQTEAPLKARTPAPAPAPAPAQSRWYHFGFMGNEEETEIATSTVATSTVTNKTDEKTLPLIQAATPSEQQAMNTSPVVSPILAKGEGQTVATRTKAMEMPPLPTFGQRSFLGLELIMGSSFPTLIDEIPIVKSKQSEFKSMIKQMKVSSGATKLSLLGQEGSASSEITARKVARRLDQASLLVEAVLSWFVKRPQTPSLLSAPATTAAIVALRNVEDAHSALADVQTQYNWIELLKNAVTSIIMTPFYPLLSALGFMSPSSMLTNHSASSTSPRHTSSSNDAFIWPDSPGRGADSDPELGGMKANKISNLQTNKFHSNTSSVTSPSPLAERGVHLLLLLMHNYRSPSRANPFRAALAKLHDPRLEGLFEQTTTVSSTSSLTSPRSPIISFEDILSSLTKSIQSHSSSEGSILLLYSLLHGNKLFTTSLLARSDLDTIIMPLLHRLYLALNNRQKTTNANSSRGGGLGGNTTESNGDKTKSEDIGVASLSSLYVAVTVLLTFTTDASFCATSFQHIVFSKVAWYQERKLTKISLGSLIILITLRLLVHTLRTLKDFFLVESLLAILGNISPHVFGIHCYAAERVVGISVMTLKNFQNYKQKAEEVQSLASSNTFSSGVDSSELAQITPLAIVYGKCAQALVSLIQVTTRPHQLRHNGQLTYSLMRKKEELTAVLNPFLSPCATAPNPNDTVEVLCHEVHAHASGLPRLLNFMGDRISVAASQPSNQTSQSKQSNGVEFGPRVEQAIGEHVRELTVQEIEHVLEDACNAYTSNDEYEPLKVAYQEQNEPEAFFVNYAWEVAHTHSSDLL